RRGDARPSTNLTEHTTAHGPRARRSRRVRFAKAEDLGPHSVDSCLVATSGSPMRVIGAGFGRTGTLSLKRALDDLGFGPTYHMEEVIRRSSHIDGWLRYARTGEVDWDALFSGFGSGVDFPVSCVWEELASHYPDAKVV